MKLHIMKLFMVSIAALCAPAFALFSAKCTTNEYCFKRKPLSGREYYITTLEQVEPDECYKMREIDGKMVRWTYYGTKEDEVSLPDEYKFCRWDIGVINAKANLDENLTLNVQYVFQDNSIARLRPKKYDSRVIHNAFKFYCEKCYAEENEKYNEFILPILKKSIGKTFTADIEAKVSCPRDANDTNYTEEKVLKINRPIVVIGECQ